MTSPLKRLFDQSQSSATLQILEYRGQQSTAMVYDHQPITDYFRKIDSNTVLGVMESPFIDQPFFFQLKRDQNISPENLERYFVKD